MRREEVRAQGRLHVPRAGEGKSFSEGTSMYMYAPPEE